MAVCVCVCVIVLEDEAVELRQQVSDARISLRDSDSARVQTERHSEQLTDSLNCVQHQRDALTDRVKELQAELTQAGEEIHQLTADNFSLTQKVVKSVTQSFSQ